MMQQQGLCKYVNHHQEGLSYDEAIYKCTIQYLNLFKEYDTYDQVSRRWITIGILNQVSFDIWQRDLEDNEGTDEKYWKATSEDDCVDLVHIYNVLTSMQPQPSAEQCFEVLRSNRPHGVPANTIAGSTAMSSQKNPTQTSPEATTVTDPSTNAQRAGSTQPQTPELPAFPNQEGCGGRVVPSELQVCPS